MLTGKTNSKHIISNLAGTDQISYNTLKGIVTLYLQNVKCTFTICDYSKRGIGKNTSFTGESTKKFREIFKTLQYTKIKLT
jgi:hypothetical protein